MTSRFRRALPCFLMYLLLVPTLTTQSVWWDEGISLHLAGLPWREIITDRAANIHPPLYFLVLSAWTRMAGSSVFAGRYLSVLVAVLLPALVDPFLRHRLGARAGRTGALLVALAPPFLIYGQETRAYAFLLPWTIVLWSLVWLAPGTREDRGTLRRGLTLGVVQVGLVLSHYAGAVAVGVATVWLLVQRLVRGRDHKGRRVIAELAIGAGVSAVLAAPWLFQVIHAGLEGLRGQAGLGSALAEPVSAGYLLGLVGLFHTVGMPEALTDPALLRSSILAGSLLGLAVLVALSSRRRRRTTLALMGLWLLPLLSVPLIWHMSPQSHPRYIYPFVLGGWLLAAALIAGSLSRPRLAKDVMYRFAGGALLAALVVTSLLGLRAYFTEPAYARSDVRGVAAYISGRAEPGDRVLVPPTDWSLAQYDLGAARLQMVREDGVMPDLSVGKEPSRVYLLDYARGALDPGGVLRAHLVWTGVLVDKVRFHGVFLEVYEVAGSPRPVDCTPIAPQCVAGEGPCLTGIAYQEQPVSGAALPVRLCWDRGPAASRYGVAFRLYASSGALVAAHDHLLVDEAGNPADTWSDQATSSYHLIPLPIGLLPVPYSLEVGVYDVDTPGRAVNLIDTMGVPHPAHDLGTTVPAVTPWRESSLYGVLPPDLIACALTTPVLSIDGAALDRPRVSPGDIFYVTVKGRARRGGTVGPDLTLGLRRDEDWLVEQRSDALPPDLPADRPVSIALALTVPATVESGVADVVLRSGDEEAVVGRLTIEGEGHRYDSPPVTYRVDAEVGDVGTLVGFDVFPGEDVRAGDPMSLTLVWRAAPNLPTPESIANLKVFVHATVGDIVVAQHDAVPAGWTRPTQGWLPEEIIVDVHELVWQRLDVAGEVMLRVGFYNPETGERVMWTNGQDSYNLPLDLTIEPGS